MADIEDPWASSAAPATPTATPSKPGGGTTSISPSAAALPLTPGPAWGQETTAQDAQGPTSLTPGASATDADPWADPWGAGAASSTSAIAGSSSSSSVPAPASPPSPEVEPSSATKSWGQEPISSPTLAMTDGIEVDDGGGWGGPIALPSPSAAEIISRTASGAGEEEKPWTGVEAREEERETAPSAKGEPTTPPSEPVTSEGPAATASKLASVFSGWRLSRVGPRPQESSLSSAAAAANAAAKESAAKKKEGAAAAVAALSFPSPSPFPSLPFTKPAQPAAPPAGQLPREGPGWKQTTKKTEPGLASKVAGFFAGGAVAGDETAKPPVVSAAEDEEEEEDKEGEGSNQAAPAPHSAPTPPQGSAVARLFARWKRGGGGEAAAGFDEGKLGKDDLAWLERLQAEEMEKGGGPGATSTSRQRDDWLGEFESGGATLNRASSSASSSSQWQPAWTRTRAGTATATATTKPPVNSLLDFDPLGPVEQPQSRRSVEQAQPSSLSREHRPDPRYHYDEDEVEAYSRKAAPDAAYSDRFDVALPPRRAGAFDNDDEELSAFQESPRLGGQARFRDEPRSVTPRLAAPKTYSGGGTSLPASNRSSINLVHAPQQQHAASPLGGNRGPLLPPPPSGRSRGNVTSSSTSATSPPMPTVPLVPNASTNARASLSSGPGLTKDDLSFFESL